MTNTPRAFRDPVLWAALLLVVLAAGVGIHSAQRWIGEPFAGFLVLDNGVVASAGLGHWPDAADVYQHEVVAVDGVPVAGGPAVRAAVAEHAPGTPVDYRLRLGQHEVERRIAVQRFGGWDFLLLYGAYLLNALVMAAVALGIRFLRRAHPLSDATFPLLLISAVWGLTGMDLYGPGTLFRLHAFAEALLAPAFLAMALGFPERLPVARRRPGLVPALWLVGIGFALLYQSGLADPSAYVRWHAAANLANATAAAVLVLSQVLRFLLSRSFEARQRIKLLALGTAVALTPPILLALGSSLSGGGLPQNAIAFTAFLFPLSLGYAVLRHNLLGVDLLIRRSLVYFACTSIVTLVYLSGSSAVDGLRAQGEAGASWATAVLPALTALMLLPLRDRIQRGVDRLFFRAAYDFNGTVERASARLAAVATLEVVAEEVRDVVCAALHPAGLELATRPSKQDPFESVWADGGPADAAELRTWAELAAASLEPWQRADGGLLVAMRTQEGLVGFLALGPRLDGRHYGEEDRRLLKVIANQAAVAVQNAYSLQAVQDLNRSLEGKVDERTTELARALAELREKNRLLEDLSARDPLTGLGSRAFACEALERELAKGEGPPLAVMMIDLDHFKSVNDTYGHCAGDLALQSIGAAIDASLEEPCVAGRYGGEELLVLLPGSDAETAGEVAERIRRAVATLELVAPDGQVFRVTVSIGVAERRDGDDGVSLVDRADGALYRAKESGRNRVERAALRDGGSRAGATAPSGPRALPGTNAAVRQEMDSRTRAIAAALPAALEGGDIRVHYQPRWSMDDGRCVGAEALARWSSRELGRVAPDEFIPLAEGLGLIHELGRRVLQEACVQAAVWVGAGALDFRVSVNVSALQLRDPDFPGVVEQALDAAGLPARHLELEITERTRVEPVGVCDQVMRRLRAMGIALSLDDFGTGFSALSCLATLPISMVKLDRSLLQGVDHDELAQRLEGGTCALAHSFGVSVVVEGIEQPALLPFLSELGGDEAQGFGLGEPMPGEQLLPFVQERERKRREGLVPTLSH